MFVAELESCETVGAGQVSFSVKSGTYLRLFFDEREFPDFEGFFFPAEEAELPREFRLFELLRELPLETPLLPLLDAPRYPLAMHQGCSMPTPAFIHSFENF